MSKHRQHPRHKKPHSPLRIFLIILAIVICIAFSAANEKTDELSIAYMDDYTYTMPGGDFVYTPCSSHIITDADSTVYYYDNLLLVFTDADLPPEAQQRLAESVNGKVVGVVSGYIHALQICVADSTLAELTALAQNLMDADHVLYACCEYPVQIMNIEETNLQAGKSQHTDTQTPEIQSDGGTWWVEAIGAHTAWEYSELCQPIHIGIVDNGFDATHEDLTGQITLISDSNRNTPQDHGTHVAGIIGAHNNNQGIRGIADTADLYCADLWPTDHYDSYHTIAEYLAMINTMAHHDVKVINNSWACIYTSKDTRWLDQRLNSDLIPTAEACIVMLGQLIDSGYEDLLIVQAAGNDCVDARYGGFFSRITEDVYMNMDSDLLRHFEDAGITYRDIDERILIVGAVFNIINSEGQYLMGSFSNYGETVDICAPGWDILSTVTAQSGSYKMEYGTSMAAPMVSGSAAFIWSLNPNLTAPEVRAILLESTNTQAIGGSYHNYCYPMLNVGEATLDVLGE